VLEVPATVASRGGVVEREKRIPRNGNAAKVSWHQRDATTKETAKVEKRRKKKGVDGVTTNVIRGSFTLLNRTGGSEKGEEGSR